MSELTLNVLYHMKLHKGNKISYDVIYKIKRTEYVFIIKGYK